MGKWREAIVAALLAIVILAVILALWFLRAR
jgi:hypothetical protein